MPESANPGGDWADVYNSKTGVKHVVPARWLEHPTLSKGIRKTPLSKHRETTNTSATGDKE